MNGAGRAEGSDMLGTLPRALRGPTSPGGDVRHPPEDRGQDGAMRIAVTGSTGLIGTPLVNSVRRAGHQVVRLVRRTPREEAEVEWDPHRQWVDTAGLTGCEAVVHLAGAGIGEHRWTEAYKKELRDSRVLGTAAIAEAAGYPEHPPPRP